MLSRTQKYPQVGIFTYLFHLAPDLNTVATGCLTFVIYAGKWYISQANYVSSNRCKRSYKNLASFSNLYVKSNTKVEHKSRTQKYPQVGIFTYLFHLAPDLNTVATGCLTFVIYAGKWYISQANYVSSNRCKRSYKNLASFSNLI